MTVMRDNKDILTVPVNVSDGKFILKLAAGVYALKVAVPGSPYPLQFTDISVKSGESTVLPPIDLTPALVTGALSGKTIPTRPDADVKLISEGRERAAVHADREGKFEFKEVPAGSYVVQAHTPRHADDIIPVVIAETAMRSNKVASKVQGCLKGSRVISEREPDGGTFEVVLELPLTGPAGLSRCIAD